MRERIQKIISASGFCSRRAAEQMIKDGKVTVNGLTALLGDSADPDADIIAVGGKIIAYGSEKVYIMLNKPKGYVTTLSDEKSRRTVAELVADVGTRVYPVGRLDMFSEGLLLLTNDGDFANNIMHPSGEVRKTYELTISGTDLDKSKEILGMPLLIDGYRIKPAEISEVSRSNGSAVLRVTIHEGRNRQIRKMCEQADCRVLRLCRTAEGFLQLGGLKTGKWRYLTEEEIASFRGDRQIEYSEH